MHTINVKMCLASQWLFILEVLHYDSSFYKTERNLMMKHIFCTIKVTPEINCTYKQQNSRNFSFQGASSLIFTNNGNILK